MEKKKIDGRSILLAVAILALIWQNISLKNQIETLNDNINNISSQQHNITNDIYSLYNKLYDMEQASRPSYGETAAFAGLREGSKLLDIKVSFSLKETETAAEVWVSAKDEYGVVTKERASYIGGVYSAVLPLDAAKAYSILYESKGISTATGELFPYYQANDELLNRFKVHIGHSEDKNGFELRPTVVNLHNGNDLLKMKTVKLVVIEQTPGESRQEIDLMPDITDSETTQYLPTGYDEREALMALAGDTSYIPPSERLESFGFPAPETSDYTIKIIITDNLDYTYTETITINRRPNRYGESSYGYGSSGGSLQIS